MVSFIEKFLIFKMSMLELETIEEKKPKNKKKS